MKNQQFLLFIVFINFVNANENILFKVDKHTTCTSANKFTDEEACESWRYAMRENKLDYVECKKVKTPDEEIMMCFPGILMTDGIQTFMNYKVVEKNGKMHLNIKVLHDDITLMQRTMFSLFYIFIITMIMIALVYLGDGNDFMSGIIFGKLVFNFI